jgi:hypothetical protein
MYGTFRDFFFSPSKQSNNLIGGRRPSNSYRYGAISPAHMSDGRHMSGNDRGEYQRLFGATAPDASERSSQQDAAYDSPLCPYSADLEQVVGGGGKNRSKSTPKLPHGVNTQPRSSTPEHKGKAGRDFQHLTGEDWAILLPITSFSTSSHMLLRIIAVPQSRSARRFAGQ